MYSPDVAATRARIVLWRAEGRRKKDVAASARVSRPTVDLWLERYAAMSSLLMVALNDSTMALLKQIPVCPTERIIPFANARSRNPWLVYCAGSTGRCNSVRGGPKRLTAKAGLKRPVQSAIMVDSRSETIDSASLMMRSNNSWQLGTSWTKTCESPAHQIPASRSPVS